MSLDRPLSAASLQSRVDNDAVVLMSRISRMIYDAFAGGR